MDLQKLKEVGIGLGVVILQVVFFRHLQIFGIRPDLILVFLLWYMFRRNRTAAVLMAAGLGFLQDALLAQWGLNMFSKTIAVFIMYNWVPEELPTRFQIKQVLTLIFIIALIHNTFFIALSSLAHAYTAELMIWKFWIGNTVYTTLAAVIIQFFRVE